uniref:Uncharacterized protein n=1 Tax=Arundo donax TaxID=35708 RepID=A0A0A8ZY79_ARUDO
MILSNQISGEFSIQCKTCFPLQQTGTFDH